MESNPNCQGNFQKIDIIIEEIKCEIYYYDKKGINKIIYWFSGEMESPESIILLETMTLNRDYAIIKINVKDWFRDLSPWKCPPLKGGGNKKSFEGNGPITFSWLIEKCIPKIEKDILEFESNKKILRYLAGYSLSGLFCLWVFYSDKNKNEELFDGIGAMSPSLWFNNWDKYMKERKAPNGTIIYFSLGDKEGKTKNETFKKMRTGMEKSYKEAKEDKGFIEVFYEENKGGHFNDCELRVAKGFRWLIEH